jgi:putative endonuclease
LQPKTTPMPTHFVYILESSDGRYYVGYTTDLKRRMDQHQSGKGAKFVRGFGFRKLLYHEAYSKKSEALKREAQLKRLSRVEKKALIRGDLS